MHAGGNALVALVHGSSENAANGLGALHMLGAACAILEIDSGSVAIELLPDGVWERGSVYSITTWELLTGIALLGYAGRRVKSTGGVTTERSPSRRQRSWSPPSHRSMRERT